MQPTPASSTNSRLICPRWPLSTRGACWFILFVCSNLLPSVACGIDAIELYSTHIKPLLKTRCYACHGALKQEAGLRLDTVASIISGEVVARGATEASLLIARVESTGDERMPPEHEGEPLSPQQVRWLNDWIDAGAPAPADEQPELDPDAHWAFQPIVRPSIPSVENAGWVRNPIDAFIAQGHEQHGVQPQPSAPRALLLRRLHLDLIGILPTYEEITAFENNPHADWYESTVERLLDDPRYGERWGRHWMDIWRYSDWWGLGDQLRNSQRHIWRWRDWIVDSLNRDRGYDEMVQCMLAGDELRPDDLEALTATGFLARNYFLFNRNQWMEETVEHVGKAFLGLTFNCAKCHDHKYDPIAQTDYYRLRAFFEPYQVRMDMVPGEADLAVDGVPRVFDGWLDVPTYVLIRGEEGNPDKSTAIEPGVPAFLTASSDEANGLDIEAVDLPAQAWQPERRPWVLANFVERAEQQILAAQAALEGLQAAQTTAAPAIEPPASEQVTEEQLALQLASLAVELAQGELHSIQTRYAAMQAQWNSATDDDATDSEVGDSACQLARQQAVRGERLVSQLVAQRDLLDVQRRLLSVADEQRQATEQEKVVAQDKLEKTQQMLAAEIKPEDRFAPLLAAQWTPTRFKNTTQDDPTVEFPSHSTGRRTELARWITQPHNPLTARVAVNHIWARHLGQPLVTSVFDFGRNGTTPANPRLLDWLASELIDSDWSMKHIHRLIVRSAVYRMSSSSLNAEANIAIDADNRWWWRREPLRLESQVVRDAILSLAGRLDPTMGGPSVPPAKQAESTRRSLYFFHSNNDRDLFLTMFDEALVTDCYRREQSIVPQQALALTNSTLVLDAAEPIAQQLSDAHDDQRAFIDKAFLVLLGKTADDAELAACQSALDKWASQSANHSQARANLVWVLLNHNDFLSTR